MRSEILSVGRGELAALGFGVVVTITVLVSIAIFNNSWQIWDTARFCGSYADFQEPPVPEVCLSFPSYFRRSLGHPPHIGPALLVGGLAAIVFNRWDRLRDIRS